MEPMLTSDVMNDSGLDYWNPDHNPLLSPPLISSTDSRTIDEVYLGSESHSEIKDRNKIIHCHLTDDLKQENRGEMEFTDHNNSPWLDSGKGKEHGINPPVSEDEGFLQERHFLSPACTNGTGFLDSLDKDSETLLDSDILTTSDLYSSLKENSGLHAAEPTTLTLADDFMESNRTTHLSSLEEEGQDDMWQAVGVMETRSKEEPLTLDNINHPQPNKSMQDSHADCSKKHLDHSVTNKIHPQYFSRANSHHYGSPAPLGWVHQSAEYSMKNHFRFRKNRCRKPLLRNFQSNFFRLPIQSRSKSPQLKMVKLFRSNTNSESDPPFQEDLHTNEDCVIKSVEDHPLEDNPELALMKTVDMPSGKRVEDIYVVPSVWITNADSTDITKCKPLPEQSPDISHSPNSLGCVTGGNSLCLGTNYSSGNSDKCQNSNSSTFPTPLVISPSCHISTNVARMSSPSTEVNWSAEGGNGIVKNLIITTLNAPKIDMIPCLKDLCKAVLHDQMPSLHDQVNTNSTQSTPPPSMNLKGVSPEFPVLDKEETDQHIHQLSDAEAQSFGNGNHLDRCPDRPSHLLDIHVKSENSQLKQPSADLIDSLSFQDLPQLNAINSPNVMRSSTDMKQTSFTQERNGPDNPYRSHNFQEDLTKIPNTATSLRDDVMPSLCAVDNEPSTSSHASAFNTNSQQMMISNSCDSIHSSCDNTNEGSSEHAHTMSSLPEASSSSSFIDSPFAGEINEEEPYNPPELITLIRQIKELHLNDPINKPLANLSTTLHLLHDAEKTLCNANFGVYQQLKMGQHSRFGQLIRCILSLTSTVVMMGKSLCEWTRSSADHQCLKTVEVLSNLYHTNIISLIELITPYFHYLCGLIASCHSDILRLNRAKTSFETNITDDISHSYGMVCQQSGISEVLSDKNNPHHANCNLSGMPSNDLQGYPNHDGNAIIHICQNNTTRRLQSERKLSMVHSDTAQLSHKHSRGSPSVSKQKKQKARLLKQRLPKASKSSPYMRPVDSKTSVTDVKYPTVKENSTVMALKVFDNVNPNKISDAAGPPLLPQILNVQAPGMSQNKMLYQTRSSTDSSSTCINQLPLVMQFGHPLPDGNKNQPLYNVGPKPFRDHDSNLALSGVFMGKKTNEKRDFVPCKRKC